MICFWVTAIAGIASTFIVSSSAATITYPDYRRQAFVCAGSIVALSEDLSGQQKQDILHALLFAQLAAQSKGKKDWLSDCKLRLKDIGFLLSTLSYGSEQYKTKKNKFSFTEPVKQSMARLAHNNNYLIELLSATLKSMQSLSEDDDRIKLFDKFGKHGQDGSFMVVTGQIGQYAPSINIGAFHFKSKQNGKDILFFEYETSKTYFQTKFEIALDLVQPTYTSVRELIIKKLGTDHIKEFIREIPLKGRIEEIMEIPLKFEK